jgi:GntR family transcriptional repressor for pyruvate dehydrogenase complex
VAPAAGRFRLKAMSENEKAGGIFEPIAQARASSAITEQIRTAIVTARLTPGERLPPERERAEPFGVSRGTVRDALRALETMGLIEVRVGARGGAFVTAPSGSVMAQTMSDMMMMSAVEPEDIVEIRLIVELGTVTLVCVRASDEELAGLREFCVEAAELLRARKYTRGHSWQFHALLASLAHNGAVDGLTQSFRSTLSMHPIRAREGQIGHERSVEEHLRIADALERRDAGTARREMAHHLMRGTNLEKRESALLGFWDAGGADQRSRDRAR